MPYVNDSHAHTRGPGAIAAVDGHKSARRRQIEALAVVAGRRREAARVAVTRGALGAINTKVASGLARPPVRKPITGVAPPAPKRPLLAVPTRAGVASKPPAVPGKVVGVSPGGKLIVGLTNTSPIVGVTSTPAVPTKLVCPPGFSLAADGRSCTRDKAPPLVSTPLPGGGGGGGITGGGGGGGGGGGASFDELPAEEDATAVIDEAPAAAASSSKLPLIALGLGALYLMFR